MGERTQMPNKNYVKGRRKEYKIVHANRGPGKISFRSAGSHSPVDVVAIDTENKTIHLIQAKPDSMSDRAKRKLETEWILLNGKFEVEFIVI